MKYYCLIILLSIVSNAAYAESIYTTKNDNDCVPSIHLQDSGDVAFVPGEDVNGWVVPHANMDFTHSNEPEVQFFLRAPNESISNQAFQENAGSSELHIGQYRLSEGKDSLNILGNNMQTRQSDTECEQGSRAILR